MAQMHQAEMNQMRHQIDSAFKKDAFSAETPHLNSSNNEYSVQLYQQCQNMKQNMEAFRLDKNKLEHALRQETLINEEYRNKIDILKKLIDNKKMPIDTFVDQIQLQQ